MAVSAIRTRWATNWAIKSAVSLRAAAKIAGRCVEALDRIADTLFALLLSSNDFRAQRGSRKITK
jgi:hypothetical protein